jgi:hypothetical protein
MKRLGVIGSLVWDRLWGWTPQGQADEPVEAWGGISYSLAALCAACPPGWVVEPILKIGRDLREPADALLAELPNLSRERILTVDEPTNRVELRYWDPHRRCEQLSGGVAPWTAEELLPRLEGLDALYVNFISGYEMELALAQRLPVQVQGPIYGDIHSLLLGSDAEGKRVLRPLPEWREWVRCFDAVQFNEDEMRTLAGKHTAFSELAAEIVVLGPSLVVVTRGAQGADYAMRPDGVFVSGTRAPADAAAAYGRVPQHAKVRDGDPTGCGDVWGSTLFAGLVAGMKLEDALRLAHSAALRKLAHRGAAGLRAHLVDAL